MALAGVNSAEGPKVEVRAGGAGIPRCRGGHRRRGGRGVVVHRTASSRWRSPTGSATRSGPSAPVTMTSANEPTARWSGTSHDAVDLRGLPVGAAFTRGVHQHLDPGADQLVAPAGGDGVLQLGALAEPLGHQRVGDLVVELGGVGADLVAEREEAHPVELGLVDPLEEAVMVRLGLARVADDERGPEGGGGFRLADGADALEEPVAFPPPAHPLDQRPGDVLQREVEVGHPGGEDGVDQGVVEGGRVEVEQPGPGHPLGHRRHQLHDGSLTADGRPVDPRLGPAGGAVEGEGGEVLGDQHHFFELAGGRAELVGLVEDRLGRTGALLAPERRDGAEPAVPVAAFGHLDVRPGGGGRRPGQVQQVEGRRPDPTGWDRSGLRVSDTGVPGSVATGRAAEPRSDTPNGATRSTSGRESASSSP